MRATAPTAPGGGVAVPACGSVNYLGDITSMVASGGVTAGSTSGQSDLINPGCNQSGGDVVYGFYISTPGTVLRFNTCGSGYDTGLSLWQDCPTGGTYLACNDDYVGCPQSFRSDLPYTFTTAGAYYIVVDGWGAGSGSYTLTVTNETP
jgi:hypothetical protein